MPTKQTEINFIGLNPGEQGYDNNQIIVSGVYYPNRGDYDGMHSFQSRSTDGFGGKMDTNVDKALLSLYKRGINPYVESISVEMNDQGGNFYTKWSALIKESPDGKAYMHLRSRGSANYGNSTASESLRQTNKKKIELKDAWKGEIKDIFTYDFTSIAKNKDGIILTVRQYFFISTEPKSYPPKPPTAPKKVEGIIVDDDTNQPITNATIKLIPLDEEPPPIDILTPQEENNFNIFVNNELTSTQQPSSPPTTATPSSTGEFEIEIKPSQPLQTSSTPPSENKIDEPIPQLPTKKPKPIIITSPGYESVEVIPYKGDGTPKDVGIILLEPLQKSVEEDKISSSQFTEQQIDELNSNKKDSKYHSQKRLTNTVSNLKSKLIPSLIALAAVFGVAGLQKLIEQGKLKSLDPFTLSSLICPDEKSLMEVIKKKNKIVSQLNKTFKVIDSTTKALGITGGVIEALNIAYQILKFIPTPSAVGGVGVPISVINAIQDSKDKIDKTIIGLRAINTGILALLVILRQTLTQIINMLNLLDMLIQKCSITNDIFQEQISQELLELTKEQSQQTSPIITNVNGFEMGIEVERTENNLKRKRAIARNKKGLVMLQGEWSFSSIPQILIDELVFYIQQNDLKAD